MESKTLYVVTLFWRDCDPFISVAGFDKSAVSRKADELADEEIERGIDDEIAAEAEDGTITEDEARANLQSDLCSTGLTQFKYPADIKSLGLDPEHVQELETQRLVVY